MPFGENGPLDHETTRRLNELFGGGPAPESKEPSTLESEVASLRAEIAALKIPLGSRPSFDDYMQMMAKERAQWDTSVRSA